MDSYRDFHLCMRCGCKAGEHRAIDGACPPGSGWADSAKFPKFPQHTYRRKGEAAAGALWDKRIARFWGASRGTFLPA